MVRYSLVVGAVIAVTTSLAWSATKCPVDAVPIQIVTDKKSGPVTTLSAAKISGSHPQAGAFVRAVTEHLATRLAGDRLCIGGADSEKPSLLQFVTWNLTTSTNEPLAAVPTLDARPAGGCRISSPWIDLAFERKPVPWIRGVVRWNERQLIADQAILAGSRNVQAGLAMPLKPGEYGGFEDDYTDSEIRGRPASKPIEERIPADLLWLFRHSGQSTRYSFGAWVSSAMYTGVVKNSEPFKKLVTALIDRCLASDGAEIHYRSILDVGDLISLEQYKIDELTR